MQAQASCDLGYISDANFQVAAHIPEAAGVVVGKGLAGESQPLDVAQRIFALFGMHGLLLGIIREKRRLGVGFLLYWIVLCKVLSGKSLDLCD